MIIKYGITLKKLALEDIEMIREWRNSPKIRAIMQNYEYITKEKQLAWFKSLNFDENIFMIIYADNLPVGLIWASDIYDTTQLGFYISNENYENSFEASNALRAFIEHLFSIPLIEQIYAKFDKKRKTEIRLLKYFGFEEGIFDSYILTKSAFRQRVL